MHSLYYCERMLLIIQGYFWSLFIAAVPSDDGTYLCLTGSQIICEGIKIYYFFKLKKKIWFCSFKSNEKNDGMLTVFSTQDTAGHLHEGPCSVWHPSAFTVHFRCWAWLYKLALSFDDINSILCYHLRDC